MLEDEVLVTEPCETRMSTGFTPMYASTSRSTKGGRFTFNFGSVANETPRSCKSFATLPMLPKGDDESIDEESSNDSMAQTPSEIMEQRTLDVVERQLPVLDQLDIGVKRQFAPEYSQSAYQTMIKEEYPIGNYTGQKYAKMQVSHRERRQIVDLIEKLHKLQQYKPESLYLATSIADRYMINQAVSGK